MENRISRINKFLIDDTLGYIEKVEDEYHKRIHLAVDTVLQTKRRIILLAGPSASGKTTTAHLICKYLKEAGVHSEIVSLDDFFLEQHQMPYDEQGVIDFESVHSLDTDGIIKALNEINETGKTELPVFNFKTKSRETLTRPIDIGKSGVVIVEGLHALNPLIADCLDNNKVLKLYISVVSSYIDNNGNELLESRNIRLMRRMSRDILYRASTPTSCLKLFSSVVRGEDKYLCPYRDTAEIELCSFHDYEICLFKPLLYDKLLNLGREVENYDRVQKIIAAMKDAVEINQSVVPKNSLMQEFIGS